MPVLCPQPHPLPHPHTTTDSAATYFAPPTATPTTTVIQLHILCSTHSHTHYHCDSQLHILCSAHSHTHYHCELTVATLHVANFCCSCAYTATSYPIPASGLGLRLTQATQRREGYTNVGSNLAFPFLQGPKTNGSPWLEHKTATDTHTHTMGGGEELLAILREFHC